MFDLENVKFRPIGISGLARSGKDSLGKFLVNWFNLHGVNAKTIAIATPLKNEVDQYCIDTWGISAWTTDTEEKKIIRPYLVEYGCQKRKESNGQHWISQTRAECERLISESYIPIITDIRFAEYENDEAPWVAQTGSLIHISRSGLEPPNDEEAKNDPVVKEMAHLRVSFNDFEKEYSEWEKPFLVACQDYFNIQEIKKFLTHG